MEFYFCGILIVYFFYIFRIDYVSKYRIRCIERDLNKYHKLATFDEMVCKFWIWDLEKFVKENINE